MNKLNFLLLTICFLIILPLTYADSGSFFIDFGEELVESDEIVTCGSINDTTFLSIVPYYIGVNESNILRTSAINNGVYITEDNASLQITFDEITWYNMTYSDEEWYTYLSSDISEDTNVTVKLTSSTYNCINATYEVKFRVPFYLTVQLYEQNSTDFSSVTRYKNDFQYIYFKLVDSTNPFPDLPSNTEIGNTFRNIYSFVPGIEELYEKQIDYTMVFWGKYTDGDAVIKLYDIGLYNIYLMNHNIDGFGWDYEFIKPQATDIVLDSRINKNLNITVAEDTVAKIYISKFESDQFGYVMNLVSIIFYGLIILLGFGLLMYIPGYGKIAVPIACAVAIYLVKVLIGV